MATATATRKPSPPTAPAKRRIPFEQASRLAQEAVRLLAPACERLVIAGSLRRRKAEIGDVELVAVPKIVRGRDLFGDLIDACDKSELDVLVSELVAAGRLSLRPDERGRTANGTRHKRLRLHPSGKGEPFALDLFAVLPGGPQWGVILAIRTGPADFSKRLVTPVSLGGWLPAGLRVAQGALWNGDAIVATPEESTLFDALDLPYLHPWHRQPLVQLQRCRDGGRVWVGYQEVPG